MSAPALLPLHPVITAESFSSLSYPRFQGRGKRGRGKVVSWLPEDQICQVRCFLSNDAPCALGPVQNVCHLHHLTSFSRQSDFVDESLDFSPGSQYALAKRAKINSIVEVSMSVGVPWSRPQKFVHSSEWFVAYGDESKEATLQKQRELRLLEAFYPRLTSVPDCPAEPAECSQGVGDKVIPEIPLVSMEDDDENSNEAEHGVGKESDVAVAVDTEHRKLYDEHRPQPQPPTSGCFIPQVASEQAGDHTIGKADPKAMATAAAAAACMAMKEFGANGLVDQELLVEILRSPAFLENLSFLNGSRKDQTGPILGQKVGNAGHSKRNPHNSNQYGGPRNEDPISTGLPSLVCVLSERTQEHSTDFLSETLSKPSDFGDAPIAKNVSSSMPQNLPGKHSCNIYPSREKPMRTESISASVQGVHASTQESGVRMKVSHALNNACAQSMPIIHVNRSCGVLAPLAPFPSQNLANFHSSAFGRMQPAHNTLPQACGMCAAAPCRTSFPDARFRFPRNEHSGLLSINNTRQKTARLCIYFNTSRGCRNGGNCAFLHQSPKQESNPIAQ